MSLALVACAGDQGQAGERGSAGAQGSQGEQGPAGERGSAGSTGSSGTSGSAGTSGSQGPAGVAGPPGLPGPSGPPGLPGPEGPPAVAGLAGAIVMTAKHDTLGAMLVDGNGRALYLFTNDERNKSNCKDNCAKNWPPLTTTTGPNALEGVATNRLGTIFREDGSTQVTYNGWPLYYYAKDEKPGDAMGQNVGTVWWAVSTDGGPIQTTANINAGMNADLGTILLDASGRSLYLFTRDEANTSNCSGNCALAWPPLITVGDPTAGDGATADKLGTITRDDGYVQVTYDSNPLYYYAKDEKPGDAMGQNVGTVWLVVSPEGKAIGTPEASPMATPEPTATPSAQTVMSNIQNFTLENLTIAKGTEITWTQLDGAPHTTTSGEPGSQSGIWNSFTLTQGQSFSFTFDQVGTFKYFCTIHPSMQATITVTES